MEAALRARKGGQPPRPREFFLAAGREYVRRFGADQLTQAAFNPGTAKRAGRPDLVERYYAGREDGATWPSLNSVKMNFGSWNAYRLELGLEPNKTGPGPGGRRKHGDAEPILNVRDRRIVVATNSPRAEWLERQLEKADRRSDRLSRELDEQKARLRWTASRPIDDHPKVVELRKRLSDENHRRKEVQRELQNALRREQRVRDRRPLAASSTLRELERLTERLAAAQKRIRQLESRPDSKTLIIREKSGAPEKIVAPTRTAVKVTDERLLAEVARLQDQLVEARATIQRMSVGWEDDRERLRDIRTESVARAQESVQVRRAEKRAADAERRERSLARLLVGEPRTLTDEEVAALREGGEAGEKILIKAIRRLGRAEGKGAQKDALTEVISAALNWRDRL